MGLFVTRQGGLQQLDRRDALGGQSGQLVGGVSLVFILLGFCWYALVASRRNDSTDAELNEILIQEILPEGQSLLSAGQESRALLGHVLADESPGE